MDPAQRKWDDSFVKEVDILLSKGLRPGSYRYFFDIKFRTNFKSKDTEWGSKT